jgi:hypothetical protein
VSTYTEQLEKQNAELQERLAEAERRNDMYAKREHLTMRWYQEDTIYKLKSHESELFGFGEIKSVNGFYMATPKPPIRDKDDQKIIHIKVVKSLEEAKQYVEDELKRLL